MAAAYDALPQSLEDEIDQLVVEHRHSVSVVARPGDHTPIPPKGFDQRVTVRHPSVRTHHESGLRTLYAIKGTAQGIVGMSQEKAQMMLERLCQHALQDRFVTRHTDRDNDLILWDNPITMLSASPTPAATGTWDMRLLWRILLRGGPGIWRAGGSRFVRQRRCQFVYV